MNLVWDVLNTCAVSCTHVELTVNPRVGLRGWESEESREEVDGRLSGQL